MREDVNSKRSGRRQTATVQQIEPTERPRRAALRPIVDFARYGISSRLVPSQAVDTLTRKHPQALNRLRLHAVAVCEIIDNPIVHFYARAYHPPDTLYCYATGSLPSS